jgi:hypothetical protein
MRFGGLRLFRLQYPFVLLLFLFSILVPCSQLFAEETIEEKQAKIAESNISFLQDQTKNIVEAAQKNQENLVNHFQAMLNFFCNHYRSGYIVFSNWVF